MEWRKQIVITEDDLEGGSADGQVALDLDGQQYEIDLRSSCVGRGQSIRICRGVRG